MGRAGSGERSSGGRSGSSRSDSSRSSGGRSGSSGSDKSRSSGGRSDRRGSGRERSTADRGSTAGRSSGAGRPRGAEPGNERGRNGRPGGAAGGPQPGGMGGPPPRGGRGIRGFGGGCSRSFSLIFIIVVVTLCLFFGMLFEPSGSSSVSDTLSSLSSSSREKLELDITYTSACVIDEVGWIDSETELGEEIRYFYEETGIQPYIYLKAYDASLTTDDEKLAYAESWYEANIDNEGTFLFVYYAEEDADEEVGYMCYVSGLDIDSVMDEEAIEVFWEKIDSYWYSDLDTEDMFAAVYEETADEIMASSTDAIDIARLVTTLAAVLVVIVFVVTYLQGRRAT